MTSMKVKAAEEGTLIEPNAVYVIPAGLNLTIAENVLHTSVRTESPGRNKPVDRFFHTLAANSKSRAIGIILSGGDGDGSEGCKSIEAAGGKVFIQDPQTAVQPSMPNTAVKKGCDDFTGSPKELAQKLSLLSKASLLVAP
jgi:two-component system, chemotaxis family, CheB/CheR fusion protein